jgi:hypothetical protein
MTVLLPPKHRDQDSQPKVGKLEFIAMAGTIICTALSVTILISRLLGIEV